MYNFSVFIGRLYGSRNRKGCIGTILGVIGLVVLLNVSVLLMDGRSGARLQCIRETNIQYFFFFLINFVIVTIRFADFPVVYFAPTPALYDYCRGRSD